MRKLIPPFALFLIGIGYWYYDRFSTDISAGTESSKDTSTDDKPLPKKSVEKKDSVDKPLPKKSDENKGTVNKPLAKKNVESKVQSLPRVAYVGVARTHLPFVVVFVKNVTSDTQQHEKNFEFACTEST